VSCDDGCCCDATGELVEAVPASIVMPSKPLAVMMYVGVLHVVMMLMTVASSIKMLLSIFILVY
jgi:hypothetical protein